MFVIYAVQTAISSSTTAVVPRPRWGRLIRVSLKLLNIVFYSFDNLLQDLPL